MAGTGYVCSGTECTPELLDRTGAIACHDIEHYPAEENIQQCIGTTSTPNVQPQNYPNSPKSHLQGIVSTMNQNNEGDYHFIQKGTGGIGKPKVSTEDHNIMASTLAEAHEKLPFEITDENGKKTKLGSKTDVKPNVKYDYDENRCITKATVTLEAKIHYPKWINIDSQCKAVKDEWNRFKKGSTIHEYGHIARAQKFFEGLAKDLIGKTPEDARIIIDQRVKDYKENEIPYDAETDHGVTQGAGLNTLIGCPGQRPFQNEDITGEKIQPLSSYDNLEGINEESDPGFGGGASETPSEEEQERQEEIVEDVDECDLDPDDPWCASLREE